ncbi:MAG: Uma2 family endonuclease [Deltaproteobacteria bacterium]|nr:Uma2 family endonuclease [Deltaproteobacteria bacterium]
MVATLHQDEFPPWFTPPPGIDELPTEDGVPLESQRHRQAAALLAEPLELHFSARADFFVGANMFVFFSALQAKRNDFRGPDVFVVLDTERRERKAWVVWEENGKGPDLVIELLSPSTEAEDRGRKKQIYERALKVREYFLYDPFAGRLDGFRLDASGVYRLIPLEASGRMKSSQVGLELGIWNGVFHATHAPWLRWFTSEGAMLPSDEDLKARAETEAARANAAIDDAKAAREEAEAERKKRVELEERLAALTAPKSGA